VTLTLNLPWSNIGTAHRLIILDICAKLFVNPTRGSKDIARTRNTVTWCLILNCDLDLDPTLVKHRHCTSTHHTWHLCKVICKSHQGFKRYRADTKVWRTDRQTDRQTNGQTDNGAKTKYLPISWEGRHNYESNKTLDDFWINSFILILKCDIDLCEIYKHIFIPFAKKIYFIVFA